MKARSSSPQIQIGPCIDHSVQAVTAIAGDRTLATFPIRHDQSGRGDTEKKKLANPYQPDAWRLGRVFPSARLRMGTVRDSLWRHSVSYGGTGVIHWHKVEVPFA